MAQPFAEPKRYLLMLKLFHGPFIATLGRNDALKLAEGFGQDRGVYLITADNCLSNVLPE